MSANNYLLISKTKYTVKICDADSDDCKQIGRGKTLLQAIKIAEKYELELRSVGIDVEYGMNFAK